MFQLCFSHHEADLLFTDKSFRFYIKNDCTMIVLQYYYFRFLSHKFACAVQWRTKLLGQLTRSTLIFPPFLLSPSPQRNVVVCAPLYTLPCPNSVSSSQHYLKGGGRASCGIQVVRDVHIMLHLNI